MTYTVGHVMHIAERLDDACGWVKTPEAWEAAAMLRLLYEENEGLRVLLLEAADDIADWGNYASEYFQEKHGLRECVGRYRREAGGT